MSKIRQNYDEEFKKNAVKLSYATSKTIKDFATDLGINVSSFITGERFILKKVTRPRWLSNKNLCGSSSLKTQN